MSRPPRAPGIAKRYTVSSVLEPELWEAVANYQKAENISNVSATVRELLLIALSADPAQAVARARRMEEIAQTRLYIYKRIGEAITAVVKELDVVNTM